MPLLIIVIKKTTNIGLPTIKLKISILTVRFCMSLVGGLFPFNSNQIGGFSKIFDKKNLQKCRFVSFEWHHIYMKLLWNTTFTIRIFQKTHKKFIFIYTSKTLKQCTIDNLLSDRVLLSQQRQKKQL